MRTKIRSILLPRGLYWKIRGDDPKSIAVPLLGNVRLINPYYLMTSSEVSLLMYMWPSQWYANIDRLFFSGPGLESPQFSSGIDAFLRRLRFVSRQAALSTESVALTTHEFTPRKFTQPKGPFLAGTFFGSFRMHTALSFEVIRAACKYKEDEATLPSEVLLDALNAHEKRDYKQAILYAAISIESVARSATEAQYLRLLTERKKAGESAMRFVRIRTTKTTEVTKDPIFEYLIKQDNFGRLLHEIPLYVMRRSMMLEEKSLFDDCKNLYSTRNVLGHGAKSPDDKPLLTLDRAGSESALATAVRAFAWFGHSNFHVPIYDSVPFPDLGPNVPRRRPSS